MKSARATVQFYFERGFSTTEIVRLLKNEKISRQFIHYTIRRLKDIGGIEDRKRTGRPRSVRTPARIKQVGRIIRKKPQSAVRKLSRKLNVSHRSLRRIIHKDLGLKAFKKRKQHGLTAAQRKKRFERCKLLLQRFKPLDVNFIAFSDEKLFVTEERYNAQNTRVYAAKFEDIPEDKRTVSHFQKPGSVMIWAAVSTQGKFPLKFIEPGVKINSTFYRQEILQRVVKPWGQRIFKKQKWTFQEDSAPSHKAKINQNWCRAQPPDFISADERPPSSPDISPLDYSIWGILEASQL